jgi:hypothetical protein
MFQPLRLCNMELCRPGIYHNSSDQRHINLRQMWFIYVILIYISFSFIHLLILYIKIHLYRHVILYYTLSKYSSYGSETEILLIRYDIFILTTVNFKIWSSGIFYRVVWLIYSHPYCYKCSIWTSLIIFHIVFSIYSAFQISAEADTELVIIIISIIQTSFTIKYK